MTNNNQDMFDQTLRLLFHCKAMLESCQGKTPQIEKERVKLMQALNNNQLTGNNHD
jgi:hypothetical protein